jgi:hypothetical protein
MAEGAALNIQQKPGPAAISFPGPTVPLSTLSTGTQIAIRKLFMISLESAPAYETEDFKMGFEAGEAVIDEIVASCNGDIRGALKALLMVNERLEDELQRLYAIAHEGGTLH